RNSAGESSPGRRRERGGGGRRGASVTRRYSPRSRACAGGDAPWYRNSGLRSAPFGQTTVPSTGSTAARSNSAGSRSASSTPPFQYHALGTTRQASPQPRDGLESR